MVVGVDLHKLNENERITLIGRSVMDAPSASTDKPAMNAFIVENDDKADRYIRKLQRQFPSIRVVDRGPGPTSGLIMVRVAGPPR